jgi:hypothetical protein
MEFKFYGGSMKTKPKNKPDLTTRNAKAYDKRFAEIELRLSRLELENETEKEQLKKIMKYFQDYFTGRRK